MTNSVKNKNSTHDGNFDKISHQQITKLLNHI